MESKTERLRPWYVLPGELHDKNGVPLYPGDLVRTYHFTSWDGRKNYLYHTAVLNEGAMKLVPTCHLEPTKVAGGGSALLHKSYDGKFEIIYGCGPKGFLDYTDRPRKKVARAEAA